MANAFTWDQKSEVNVANNISDFLGFRFEVFPYRRYKVLNNVNNSNRYIFTKYIFFKLWLTFSHSLNKSNHPLHI